MRASTNVTLYPGQYIELTVARDIGDEALAIEPRMIAIMSYAKMYAGVWPQPTITASIGSKVRIPNVVW